MNLKLFWIRTDVFCKDKHKKHVHSLALLSTCHKQTRMWMHKKPQYRLDTSQQSKGKNCSLEFLSSTVRKRCSRGCILKALRGWRLQRGPALVSRPIKSYQIKLCARPVGARCLCAYGISLYASVETSSMWQRD